jgi:glucose/mannose-6-phosphate isomerase
MGADEIRPALDDPARVEAVDRRNMLRQINEFPEQCETALGIARSFESKQLDFEPSLVLLTGTGDCGTAADMAAVVSDRMEIPLISKHGGYLPSYVNERTLVLVVDYTGNGRSALQNYKEARARNAEVVCITGGGKLGETASKDGVRVVKIPSAQLARTAVGYMFIAALAVMSQYGVSGLASDAVYSAIKLLKSARESLRFEYPASRNLAKQAAEFLYAKFPVIFGSTGYRSVVARRWKSQLGANSKRPAIESIILDAAAGEISAWELAGGSRDMFAFVFLRDPADKDADTVILIDKATQLLGESYRVLNVDIAGVTAAEKVLHGLYFADYVSYYLALLYEIDPTKTDYITAMESENVEDS